MREQAPSHLNIVSWAQNSGCFLSGFPNSKIMMKSSDSFTNFKFWIYNFFRIHTYLLWFFFQMANWEKGCFGPITNLFSFPTAQTEKNSWTKLVKTSDEFVISKKSYSTYSNVSIKPSIKRPGLNFSKKSLLNLKSFQIDRTVLFQGCHGQILVSI